MYIENHLGDRISVEDVALAAGYSYYHLTRQFSVLLGESIGNYIKKRRLADGAKKLLYTNLRIIDIAMETGFESSESFSRAFKAVYKVSPQAYRNNRASLYISIKEKLDPGLMTYLTKQITVHPRIVEIPQILVAGIRGRTTLRDNVLPQLWKRFRAVSGTIPHVKTGARAFGICEACDEGNTIYTMNDDVVFPEVAGLEVDSFEGLPSPFVQKRLAGGKYAVFTHTGSLADLKKTFEYIWGTWFLLTKEELDDREDFELYDERFISFGHPESRIDLYIPVK